jgi:hypothetical protein
VTKWFAALATLLTLAACTSSSSPPGGSTSTHTNVVVHTNTPSVSQFTPPPAATVHSLPYGAKTPNGEKDARCPYIKTGLDQDYDYSGDVNLANLEGDRVYRTTRLLRYHPVGCRFYFYSGPYEAIADIRPYTFKTAVDAYNAMVRTAEAGREPIAEKGFVRGLTGICFRTKYFAPDGFKDWAFVFAKGKRMVVVYTQRKDTSRNALYIGRAIAAKF